MKKVYYIGLDVHKEKTQIAVLEETGKEAIELKVVDSDVKVVAKAILPYQKKGDLQVAYEAGCMGYTLYRLLNDMEISCRVIAPNKIFYGGKNEKIKTDKRDALAIAWMLRREEGGSIAVPSQGDEATRD